MKGVTYECHECGHTWIGRKTYTHPDRCPRCQKKSAYVVWDDYEQEQNPPKSRLENLDELIYQSEQDLKRSDLTPYQRWEIEKALEEFKLLRRWNKGTDYPHMEMHFIEQKFKRKKAKLQAKHGFFGWKKSQ